MGAALVHHLLKQVANTGRLKPTLEHRGLFIHHRQAPPSTAPLAYAALSLMHPNRRATHGDLDLAPASG